LGETQKLQEGRKELLNAFEAPSQRQEQEQPPEKKNKIKGILYPPTPG